MYKLDICIARCRNQCGHLDYFEHIFTDRLSPPSPRLKQFDSRIDWVRGGFFKMQGIVSSRDYRNNYAEWGAA